MKPQLERLKMFALINYGSIRKMSIAAGLSSVTIQTYIYKDSIPGNKIRPYLLKLGLNLNWLDTGEGEMYAENDNGKLLKFEHDMEEGLKKGEPLNKYIQYSSVIPDYVFHDLSKMKLEEILNQKKQLLSRVDEIDNFLKDKINL